MNLGIVEEKRAQTAPWTDQLRAKIGEKLLLSSSINWRETRIKKRAKTQKENKYTHSKDREKKKREARTERATDGKIYDCIAYKLYTKQN